MAKIKLTSENPFLYVMKNKAEGFQFKPEVRKNDEKKEYTTKRGYLTVSTVEEAEYLKRFSGVFEAE